jgi:oxygen-independent coproporphyrinogen III oxidase
MMNGIYIHVPFCLSRCLYCHFPTQLWQEALAERYAKAVVREIAGFVKTTSAESEVDSIYFGGGTPSLLSKRLLGEILDVCRNSFAISPDCEISLEANPDTITELAVSGWRGMGINRVSIGAQTFSDEELRAIGRTHSAAQIESSIKVLHQFEVNNINLDLMLGLPKQTGRQWLLNLEAIQCLMPEHLSIYMLDLDGSEPLYQSIQKGMAVVPDEDSVADWYLASLDHLSKSSYVQYEISNFALPGFQCRHNLKYWRRIPVWGFGQGSHSHDGKYRYANHADLNTYLRCIEGGESPVEWRKPVNEQEALQETLFLGLRLCSGIDWDFLERRFPQSQTECHKKTLQELMSQGLVQWQGANIRLTPSGMLLSNEVFQRFI